MPESEVRDRLDRIRGYNLYQQRAGQPHFCTTVSQLASALESWGHDPARANGIGTVPEPSPLLAEIARREAM